MAPALSYVGIISYQVRSHMAHLGFDYEYHMKNTQFLRNICILAHVDHGKTTFSDYLIASNGIISQRDIGKIHYLDCREDEQLKQITMKSSCITLLYSTTDYLSTTQCYLINLLDTPGHVDFSAEVKTAVGLSDGAFLLIDVVEGICPQTRSAMKQIYLERLSPCLVINKMDKLIVNMGLNPLEAYNHIFQLIEQINAVMAGFNTYHEFESDLQLPDECNISEFSPLECNVIFISSLDGWGFNLETFTDFFANELGYSKKILSKTLWGDYYISHKAQRILPNAHAKGKWPLFASLILDSIWSIYRFAYLESNVTKISKMVKKLRIDVAFKEYKNSMDRQLLKSIFNQWLPLSKAALNMAVSKMPGPRELSDQRIERLLTNYTYQSFSSLPIEVKYLKHHFKSCKLEENIPQIAYISKMMSFTRKVTSQFGASTAKEMDDSNPSFPSDLPDYDLNNSSGPHTIVAIARVFSGTLFRGQMLYILHPHYDPKDTKFEIQEPLNETELRTELPPNVSIVKVSELYLLMGGELINVGSVPAGNICGVYGLDKILLRNGTLSNTLHCIPFTPLYYITPPILKVALEPIQVSQLDSLIRGINLLAQVDPCVQTSVEESGEYVIHCAGEVHLQKCIEDLSKNFAVGVDFEVSAPIISFRETVIYKQDLERFKYINCDQPSNLKLLLNNPNYNIFVNSTPNKNFEISMTVRPIPTDIVRYLEDNVRVIRLINSINAQREISHFQISENDLQTLKIFKSRLNELMLLAGDEWMNGVDNIWSFGPKMVGPNILLNSSPDNLGMSIWPMVLNDNQHFSQSFYSNITHGFQLATLQGPLCNEPLVGVCFIIINYENTENPAKITQNKSKADIATKLDIRTTNNAVYGPLSGQIISTVVKTCKQALAAEPIRLMRAMFSCSIQCSQDVLGYVITVINRRGGKCLDQSIQVGTNLFILETFIPVAESIGFSDEIRKKTSGLAIPQLMFSHWEVLVDDPFWIPTTEDELLHFGEKADSENIAKKYVDSIRKRKGLLLKANVVESAEKQRTFKK